MGQSSDKDNENKPQNGYKLASLDELNTAQRKEVEDIVASVYSVKKNDNGNDSVSFTIIFIRPPYTIGV